MPDVLDAPAPTRRAVRPSPAPQPGPATPPARPARRQSAPPPVIQESPRPMRVTVEMYHAMIGAGIFDGIEGRRIELLDEELVEMAAAYAPHEFHVELAADLLKNLVPAGWGVREEKGLALPRSEPEPDVAVVNKARKFFRTRKPRADETLLILEVSDSSLHHDRTRKAAIYAAAGLDPYWIVNLPDRVLEVRTDPHVAADGVAEYRGLDTREVGETVEFTLSGRSFSLAVADLLPAPPDGDPEPSDPESLPAEEQR